MKLRIHHVIYLGIVIAAGVLLLGGRGPERAIRGHLDELAGLLAKAGDESGLVLADRARRLGESFADNFVIVLEPFGLEIRDRSTLARQFAAYRHGTETIDARFTDVEVELGAGERTASVSADAVLTATWRGGQPGRERYRLRFDVLLHGGDWKIERLTLVEVVEGAERFF